MNFQIIQMMSWWKSLEAYAKHSGLQMTKGADQLIQAVLKKVHDTASENFANGRSVRNIYEKILTVQANRLGNSTKSVSDTDLATILVDDVKAILPQVF